MYLYFIRELELIMYFVSTSPVEVSFIVVINSKNRKSKGSNLLTLNRFNILNRFRYRVMITLVFIYTDSEDLRSRFTKEFIMTELTVLMSRWNIDFDSIHSLLPDIVLPSASSR